MNISSINDKNLMTKDNLKFHNKRVGITKEFTFDAAHNLLMYDGKCKFLHGHTYRLIITLSGLLRDDGICIDFSEIKEIYDKAVGSKLDHNYLNEILPQMNTTAENIIVWIWEQIDCNIKSIKYRELELRIEELKLYETPTSYAILKHEWMEE